ALPPAADRPLPGPTPTPTPTGTPTPVPIDPATLAFYELPPFARRDTAMLGPLRSADGGFAADAFGRADGPYLSTLMRRLSAPLPSRWLSITLRRLLVSELATPAHADGADFSAERAWLLLRMGESVGARAVAQGVDQPDYTPKLYQVALNTLLATADPSGMCPLAERGAAITRERGWVLAQAICAGLGGSQTQAAALIKQARNRRTARGVDLLLAQKVIGAGAGGRESITVEWNGVDELTAWRFGLATATGVAIPDELMAGTGAQVRYWQALSPAVAPEVRLASAEAAAAQGVLSSAALVDLYGLLRGGDDTAPATDTAADDLRQAYTARSADARQEAMRRLWGAAGRTPYPRLLLTARAAARLPARAEQDDADRLVASMLSAGLDRAAVRWRPYLDASGDGWAMLALADPDLRGQLSYSALARYAGTGDAAHKQRLLFAGLAGLGRLSPEDIERAAQALDVRIGAQNSWTQALDRAVAAGEAGTVVLLAGIGLQTADWRGVPPSSLFRVVSALRAVGLEGEARMIAAEALARA
ncbi:MAG: hypothetical protein JWN21_2148, partial [Sphingomonas bacterium]|uniref:hypothetical protein n=1 Tax=Sphingomonas bacterium TaxID=1895847 RepID=UPI002A621095|nr:hypothetical protein [Sphingomonas bacterium]